MSEVGLVSFSIREESDSLGEFRKTNPLQVVQNMTTCATRCTEIVFGRQRVPLTDVQQSCPIRAVSPLWLVRKCLHFRHSIAYKGVPSIWITAYPTQGHSGLRLYYRLTDIVTCRSAEVMQHPCPYQCN